MAPGSMRWAWLPGVWLLGAWLLLASPVRACSMGDRCRTQTCHRCPGLTRCLGNSLGDELRFCVPPKRGETPSPAFHRPYNRNAFLVTHNSYAHENAWTYFSANQRRTLQEQLDDGVRGFMLDLHELRGEVHLCHGHCRSNAKSGARLILLRTALASLKRHLQANPHEVLTLFIESYVPDAKFLQAMVESGIAPYVFPKRRWPRVGEDWPTLRDMAPAVVIFGKGDWDHLKETMYGTINEGLCDQRPESRERGGPRRNLLLVNHFMTFFGRTNVYPSLQEKLLTCRRTQGQLANFLAVDFYENNDTLGGAKMAVRWLDSQWAATSAAAGNSV